jgi:hypothetical protein
VLEFNKLLVSLRLVVRVTRCCGKVQCRPEFVYTMYLSLGSDPFFDVKVCNYLAFSFLRISAGLEGFTLMKGCDTGFLIVKS